MVVLNIYSKTDPICISKKLGLYISNLPNDWKTELKERILESKEIIERSTKKYNIKKYNFYEVYNNILKEQYNKSDSEEIIIDKIVENMICIYFDYDYDDMPLGDWSTNCFDGRFCEEDYAEKIIDFISFSFDVLEYQNKVSICYIYSSNYDRMENEYQVFYNSKEPLKGIETLIKWGELFDNFLNNREAYLKFDYLVNSIHKDNEHNEYNFFKLYSLCQLFLEKSEEVELDWKLPYFFDSEYSLSQRTKISKSLRQMRNKIAHGDFLSFEEKIEEYAEVAMKGFWYDYSEYSRKNWIIINACCLMNDILKKIIETMFYKNDILLAIKSAKKEEQITLMNLENVINNTEK